MSEQAPEAPAAAPQGGNVLTRKIGPLSMWVWLLIVIAAGAAYYLYKARSSSNAAATTDASQVPQFVNQVYTSPTPPSAPLPVGPVFPPPGTGGPPPVISPPGVALYWHQDPAKGKSYFSLGGSKISQPAGNVTIGGKTYYWHPDKGYFTINGKKVKPPASGPVNT